MKKIAVIIDTNYDFHLPAIDGVKDETQAEEIAHRHFGEIRERMYVPSLHYAGELDFSVEKRGDEYSIYATAIYCHTAYVEVSVDDDFDAGASFSQPDSELIEKAYQAYVNEYIVDGSFYTDAPLFHWHDCVTFAGWEEVEE